MTEHPGRTLLVVDDSPTAVMYLSLLLKRMGFGVVPARDGAEALRLLDETQPDAVLLDVRMPNMDGIGFLRSLRDQARFDPPPVVMITVESDPGVVAQCEALGCRAYLRKPVDLKELHATIQACFQSGKRRHLRAPLGREVTVAARGASRPQHAITLSEGGIYLRMADPLPVGTPVDVTLFMEDGRPLTLGGEVIYDKGVYSGATMSVDPGVAIVFGALTPEQTAHLAGMVRRLLMAGLFQEVASAIVKDA